MSAPSLVVVVVGGDGPLGPLDDLALPADAVVVAADSGLDAAVAAGFEVHHVVGDLDSVRPATLAAAEAGGAEVHRHPADKDATDGALALELSRALLGPGGGKVVVLGAGGGRLDHLLADVSALAAPALAAVEVTARLGAATLTVVRPGRSRTVTGAVGEQVSLLPVHGDAGGVTTTGLRWALVDADLVAGTTRAVSNELIATAARVAVGSGVVVVVQPGTMAGMVAARDTPYDPRPRGPATDRGR